MDDRRRAARRPVVTDLRDGYDRAGSGNVETEARLPLGADPQAALGALTVDQRDVIFPRVVAELSLEQTAEVLGKPLGAVKALQHRGLGAARRFLMGPLSPV